MKLQTPKEYSEWLVDLQVEGQSVYAWAIAEYIKSYANQRVIEEFNKIPHLKTPLGEEVRMSSYYVLTRIKELKQD